MSKNLSSGQISSEWELAFKEWDQWDEIIEFIEAGQCILMLGPDISTSPENGKSYIEIFCERLLSRLKDTPRYSTSFSKIASAYKHEKTTPQFDNRVKKFYGQKLRPSNVYKYIAKMPFPLIINTSPDHLLKEAYNNAIFDYYNFKSNRDEPTSSGTKKNPLIYNLFGSAVEPESLVITEKDRLDFLVNTIKRDPPIPRNLLSEKIMDNNKMFLFIGFDFNEWYLRLLLNILSLNNDRFACAIDRHDVESNREARVFYTHNFNLSFLNAPFDQFIKKLYDLYTHRHPFVKIIEENDSESQVITELTEPITPIIPEVLITAEMVDKNFVVELEKILQPEVIKETLKIWDGSKIKSGDVKKQIEARIGRAEIVVLCLSPDSLTHIMTEVIPILSKREKENDDLKVVPISYKKCLHDRIPYLKSKTIYPLDEQGNATSISDWHERADAYKQIAEVIIQTIED